MRRVRLCDGYTCEAIIDDYTWESGIPITGTSSTTRPEGEAAEFTEKSISVSVDSPHKLSSPGGGNMTSHPVPFIGRLQVCKNVEDSEPLCRVCDSVVREEAVLEKVT